MPYPTFSELKADPKWEESDNEGKLRAYDRWSAGAISASAGATPEQKKELTERIYYERGRIVDGNSIDSLKRGILSLSGAVRTGVAAHQAEYVKALDKSLEDPRNERFKGLIEKRRERALARMGKQLQQADIDEDLAQQIPQDAGMREFIEAEGFQESTKALFNNFGSIVSNGLAESASMMVAPIAGGVIGGITTGNPVGAAAGAFLGGSAPEFAISYREALQEIGKENGIDTTSPEGLAEAMSNEDVNRQAVKRGLIRAGIIGGVDAATGGAGAKIGVKAGEALFGKSAETLSKELAKNLTAVGTSAAIGAPAGSFGEFAAQAASGQDIDVKDIALEGIVQAGTSVGQAGTEIARTTLTFNTPDEVKPGQRFPVDGKMQEVVNVEPVTTEEGFQQNKVTTKPVEEEPEITPEQEAIKPVETRPEAKDFQNGRITITADAIQKAADNPEFVNSFADPNFRNTLQQQAEILEAWQEAFESGDRERVELIRRARHKFKDEDGLLPHEREQLDRDYESQLLEEAYGSAISLDDAIDSIGGLISPSKASSDSAEFNQLFNESGEKRGNQRIGRFRDEGVQYDEALPMLRDMGFYFDSPSELKDALERVDRGENIRGIPRTDAPGELFSRVPGSEPKQGTAKQETRYNETGNTPITSLDDFNTKAKENARQTLASETMLNTLRNVAGESSLPFADRSAAALTQRGYLTDTGAGSGRSRYRVTPAGREMLGIPERQPTSTDVNPLDREATTETVAGINRDVFNLDEEQAQAGGEAVGTLMSGFANLGKNKEVRVQETKTARTGDSVLNQKNPLDYFSDQDKPIVEKAVKAAWRKMPEGTPKASTKEGKAILTELRRQARDATVQYQRDNNVFRGITGKHVKGVQDVIKNTLENYVDSRAETGDNVATNERQNNRELDSESKEVSPENQRESGGQVREGSQESEIPDSRTSLRDVELSTNRRDTFRALGELITERGGTFTAASLYEHPFSLLDEPDLIQLADRLPPEIRRMGGIHILENWPNLSRYKIGSKLGGKFGDGVDLSQIQFFLKELIKEFVPPGPPVTYRVTRINDTPVPDGSGVVIMNDNNSTAAVNSQGNFVHSPGRQPEAYIDTFTYELTGSDGSVIQAESNYLVRADSTLGVESPLPNVTLTDFKNLSDEELKSLGIEPEIIRLTGEGKPRPKKKEFDRNWKPPKPKYKKTKGKRKTIRQLEAEFVAKRKKQGWKPDNINTQIQSGKPTPQLEFRKQLVSIIDDIAGNDIVSKKFYGRVRNSRLRDLAFNQKKPVYPSMLQILIWAKQEGVTTEQMENRMAPYSGEIPTDNMSQLADYLDAISTANIPQEQKAEEFQKAIEHFEDKAGLLDFVLSPDSAKSLDMIVNALRIEPRDLSKMSEREEYIRRKVDNLGLTPQAEKAKLKELLGNDKNILPQRKPGELGGKPLFETLKDNSERIKREKNEQVKGWLEEDQKVFRNAKRFTSKVNDVKSLLKWVADKNDNGYGPLAKYLAKNIPKFANTKIFWLEPDARAYAENGNLYLPLIPSASFEETGVDSRTALHEIVHNFTAAEIWNNFDHVKPDKWREQLQRFADTDLPIGEIARAYMLARDQRSFLKGYAVGAVATDKFVEQEERRIFSTATARDKKIAYGLANLHEFVSMAFEDREFQQWLDSIPDPNRKQSVWKTFLDTIQKILGIPVSEGSLLETVVVASDNTFLNRKKRDSLYGGKYAGRLNSPSVNKQRAKDSILFQENFPDEPQGFYDRAENFIGLLPTSNASTLLHEFFHAGREMMAETPELKTLENFYGVNDGNWTRDQEETFARHGERYFRDGKAPKGASQKVKDAFATFADTMRKIYRVLKGSPIEEKVPKEVREFFDAVILAGDTEADVDPSIRYDRENMAPSGELAAAAVGQNSPHRIPVEPLSGDVRPNRDVLFDVARNFGKNIKYKGQARKTYGTYNTTNSRISIRYEGDLDTTAHELGHAIDDQFNIGGTAEAKGIMPDIDAELLTPTFQATSAKDYDRGQKRAEGFAEFIRALIVNPDATRREAPETAKLFDELVSPKTKRAIDRFSRDIRAWEAGSPGEQILANVQLRPDSKLAEAVKLFRGAKKGNQDGFTVSGWDRVAAAMLDDKHPFLKAVDYIEEQEGLTPLPSNDPRVMARLLQGVGSKEQEVLENGMVDAEGNFVLPGGVEWLLEPFGNQTTQQIDKDLRAAVALMIAERTVELADRFGREDVLTGAGAGIKTDLRVAQEAIAEYKKDPERYKRLQEAANRYRQWADANLRYMVEKGRLSQEAYDNIVAENTQYVALSRMMETAPGEEMEAMSFGAGKNLGSVSETLQRIKGSTKTIRNPYVTLLESSGKIMRESDRNEVLALFADMLDNDRRLYEGDPNQYSSVGSRIQEGTGAKNTQTIFRNGEKEIWQFDDDIHKALKGLQKANQLPWVFTFLAKALKWGVTSMPAFAIRNIMRDTQARFLVSRSGIREGLQATVPSRGENNLQRLKLGGGDQAGFYTRDETDYMRALDMATRELATDSRNAMISPKEFARFFGSEGPYFRLLQKGEQANRLAEYKAAYKDGKAKGYNDHDAHIYAASQARELMDFAVAGYIGRTINQVVPFFNAAIQGTKRNVIAATENPRQFAARFLLFAVIPTLAQRALIAAMGKDVEDEYEELPAYLRDMYWNFKVGPDHWLRIPKNFEAGVLASLSDRGIAALRGYDGTMDGYLQSLKNALVPVNEQSLFGSFKPVVEAATNYDSFREKGIVSPFEVGVDLDAVDSSGDRIRKSERASRIGRGFQSVAETVGLGDTRTGRKYFDARVIDFLFKGTLGNFGDTATRLSNIGRDDTGNKIGLRDTGIVVNSPAYAAKTVQEVYKLAERNRLRQNKMFDTLDELIGQYFNATKQEAKAKDFSSVSEYRDYIGREIRREAKRIKPILEAEIEKRKQ